ncbi:MAG: hypothetical protein U1F36_06120 [Planctomycetota bacterium]
MLGLCACRAQPGRGDSAFDALVGAGPIVIPLAGPVGVEPQALDTYYRSILTQMQQAVAERDVDWLDMLLAQHDREVAPDWAKDAIRSYRSVGRALRMETWVQSHTRIETRDGPPLLGAMLSFALRIEGRAPDVLRLPGDGEEVAPTRFLVHLTFEDRDCLGGTSRAEFEDMLTLHDGADLDGDVAVVVPFDVDAPPVHGCERRVELLCELLPGARLLEGDPVPGHRAVLVDSRFPVYPRGIEALKRAPLATLRNAVESRDPRYFDHVWLASRLVDAAQRGEADELLVGAIRLGPADLARVAGACLAESTGLSIPPTDRDGWLAWWQAQQRRKGGG